MTAIIWTAESTLWDHPPDPCCRHPVRLTLSRLLTHTAPASLYRHTPRLPPAGQTHCRSQCTNTQPVNEVKVWSSLHGGGGAWEGPSRNNRLIEGVIYREEGHGNEMTSEGYRVVPGTGSGFDGCARWLAGVADNILFLLSLDGRRSFLCTSTLVFPAIQFSESCWMCGLGMSVAAT